MTWVLFVVMTSGLYNAVPLDLDIIYKQEQCETLGQAVTGGNIETQGFICVRMAREDALRFDAEVVEN